MKLQKKSMKVLLVCLAIIVVPIIIKAIWVGIATRHNGDFESEKADIMARRDFLIEKVMTSPQKLIDEMPAIVGSQFQGEWALYSCSMLSAALVNTTLLYDEDKEENIARIDSLIQIVMSPELRAYDRERWGEDPLETLDGKESHVSYLSHLAWMIGGYKRIGGGDKYDELYHRLCETMNRRILESPNMNLPTYPGECVYVPDMLVAIVALSVYSQQYEGKYYSTVYQWLAEAKQHWLDKDTGMLASFLPDEREGMYGEAPIKGSYSALSCYYLTFIDEEFAQDQYERLKANFLQKRPITGFKEYHDRRCWLGMDIDAGPIVCNLSPTGTAFAVGSVTYFEDWALRKKLLKTGELAGTTWRRKGKSHYLLADVALVGEAIMLAMRTAIGWEFTTHRIINKGICLVAVNKTSISPANAFNL